VDRPASGVAELELAELLTRRLLDTLRWADRESRRGESLAELIENATSVLNRLDVRDDETRETAIELVRHARSAARACDAGEIDRDEFAGALRDIRLTARHILLVQHVERRISAGRTRGHDHRLQDAQVSITRPHCRGPAPRRRERRERHTRSASRSTRGSPSDDSGPQGDDPGPRPPLRIRRRRRAA
jgi:hypothetical protein